MELCGALITKSQFDDFYQWKLKGSKFSTFYDEVGRMPRELCDRHALSLPSAFNLLLFFLKVPLTYCFIVIFCFFVTLRIRQFVEWLTLIEVALLTTFVC